VLVPIAPGIRDDAGPRSRYRDGILADLTAHAEVDLRDRIVVEEEACVAESRRATLDPRGRRWGWHTRSDRPVPSGRAIGPARTGSISSAPTPPRGSTYRCV